MKKKSIEILTDFTEDRNGRLPEYIKDEAQTAYDKEISTAYRAGAIASLVGFFAIVGIISLLASCNKCVTCETTTTTTDLNDVPTSSVHQSFPVCDHQEKKYWNGRKTTQSMGTYKVKTSTICTK